MNAALKALSALLTYPTAELQAATGEIAELIEKERMLPRPTRNRLFVLLEELAMHDLYDLQERYVLLFDRTRSLSLHLFEHVHGESRDRGQAMINLKSQYEAHGLEMRANELPDFLPLFLEYVSLLPPQEARDTLRQPAHILTVIAERLVKRASPYEAVFRAVLALADTKPNADEVSALLQTPDADASDLTALDEAWEDTPVSFGPDSACKDGIVARVRGAMRPAPGLSIPSR
jgi:nitrate reductase molybdenum cofactor assembly chaperone NarJ/NarW